MPIIDSVHTLQADLTMLYRCRRGQQGDLPTGSNMSSNKPVDNRLATGLVIVTVLNVPVVNKYIQSELSQRRYGSVS